MGNGDGGCSGSSAWDVLGPEVISMGAVSSSKVEEVMVAEGSVRCSLRFRLPSLISFFICFTSAFPLYSLAIKRYFSIIKPALILWNMER